MTDYKSLKRGKIGAAFQKFYRAFDKVMRIILIVVLVILTSVVFLNVMGRYVFRHSISWSEEISVFAMVWLVFFGGISAFINDEHLQLDLLPKSLPPKASVVLMIVVDCAVGFASYILAWGGIRYILSNLDWSSPVLQIPYSYLRAPLPICGIVLLILAIMKIIEKIEILILMMKEDAKV